MHASEYTVREFGFMVNMKWPWIGASPDGLVFDSQGGQLIGCIEIKSPYSIRGKTIQEAVDSSLK